MRLLGLCHARCSKFCGLMDLSCSFLFRTVYYSYMNKILECVRKVAIKLFLSVSTPKIYEMCAEDGIDLSDLTVSGDRPWEKNVNVHPYLVYILSYDTTLAKCRTFFCKSSYCKQRETGKQKCTTAEFEELYTEHVESNECNANLEGPSGNMEVQAILKLFELSHDKYGLNI